MTKNKPMKRWIALLLSIMMVLSLVLPTAAVGEEDGFTSIPFEQSDIKPDLRPDYSDLKKDKTEDTYAADDIVPVSIVLKGASTLDRGFSAEGIADNASAMAYRGLLKLNQLATEVKIEREALKGKDLDVVWNLTLATNVISANVRYDQIEAIKAVDGVKAVVIETEYYVAVVDTDLPVNPNMSTSSSQIGSADAWSSDYWGGGSVVAIVDTGVTFDHQSFNAAAYEYALQQHGYEGDILEQQYIADHLSQLNAYNKGETAATGTDGVYKTSKVPFGYNYYVGSASDSNVKNSSSEHGSHVAGIAAANAYIPNGTGGFDNALSSVRVQGVAPDAQILAMNVFAPDGKTNSAYYMVAIEDAILLGADSVNLSLGSSNSGLSRDIVFAGLLKDVTAAGVVVVLSAGNSYAFADYSVPGAVYDDDVNFNTVGSPGSYNESLAVASVDNAGATGVFVVLANGNPVAYNDMVAYSDIPAFTSLAGEHEYVFFDGGVTVEDFAEAADAIDGKIVVCSYGEGLSALTKIQNAVAYGAIGYMEYYNTSGGYYYSDNLANYDINLPVVTMTQAAGATIKANAAPVAGSDGETLYYAGSMTVNGGIGTAMYNSKYYTMSDFSSWGVPGSLTMKPEITAPGGDIYSVDGFSTSDYLNMDGTSMAAPQVTGMAAVLGQYIEENDLVAKTGMTQRQLINSLLMATAKPILEEGGYYYSILKQGSGLGNVGAAVQAQAVIKMAESTSSGAADGKVKVELGDDPAKSGSYTFTFTIKNISGEDSQYTLSTDLFTQLLASGYLLKQTTPLNAAVVYTVDGKTFVPRAAVSADVNKDGVTDATDAQALLDYIVGNNDGTDLNLDVGDLDKDGNITSYDAHLILANMTTEAFTVPADGEVTVKVEINVDKDQLNAYKNGAYVEGYTFVKPVAQEDSAVLDVEYSIPILGFYGNWTAPAMFDRITVYEYLNAIENGIPYEHAPYTGELSNVLYYEDSITGEEYLQIGNPYIVEPEFPTGKAAVRSEDLLTRFEYSLLRNAAILMTITDGNGDVIWYDGFLDYAAFYSVSGRAWDFTTYEVSVEMTASELGLKEGETFTVSLYAIPEYYLSTELYDALYTQDDSMTKEMYDALNAIVPELGDGAKLSTTLRVDDTAPAVISTGWLDGDLMITMKDNQYIAYLALVDFSGETVYAAVPEQTEEGAVVNFTIPSSEISADGKYIIYIADYADNYKAYTIDLSNGGVPSDDIVAIGIEIEPDSILVPLNGAVVVPVTVIPYLADMPELEWSVEEDSVATVADGVVTGVAVGEATVTVKVKGSDDPAMTDSVTVSVVQLNDFQMHGFIQDASGTGAWSTFNVQNTAGFTSDILGASDFISGTLDTFEDYVYAQNSDGILYVLDPDTLATVQRINVGYQLPDAASNAWYGIEKSDWIVVAPMANSTMILVLEIGGLSLSRAGDLGNYLDSNIAAITWVGQISSNKYDLYYILLESGEMWQAVMNNSGKVISIFDMGNIGLKLPGAAAGDGAATASLIYDFENGDNYTEYMYLAYSLKGETKTNLATIEVKYTEEYDVESIGVSASTDFGSDVRPVTSLYQYEADLAENRMNAKRVDAILQNSVKLDTDEDEAIQMTVIDGELDLNKLADHTITSKSDTKAAAGSLNSIVVDSAEKSDELVDTDANTITITVSASESTNGKFTVEYDSDLLKLESVNGLTTYYAYNDSEAGKVVFAYAAAEALEDQVATLIFSYKEEDESGLKTEIAIITDEDNDVFEEAEEIIPVEIPEKEEPTEPSEEPTEPSEEPTEPSEEPTEPSEEPTEPSASGNVEHNVQTGEGAPNVQIPMDVEDLADAVLNEEENEALESGANVEIILTVEVQGVVDPADKAAVEMAAANKYVAGLYLELNLEIYVNNELARTVKLSEEPIRITVDIPEELRAEGREYVVFRLHDGAVDILKDLDSNPNTITFETDRFSTYVIGYTTEETEEPTEPSEEPTEPSEEPTEPSEEPTVTPPTGDDTLLALLVATMVLSAAALFGVAYLKRRAI